MGYEGKLPSLLFDDLRAVKRGASRRQETRVLAHGVRLGHAGRARRLALPAGGLPAAGMDAGHGRRHRQGLLVL